MRFQNACKTMIYQMNIDTPSYLCDVNDRLHPWAAIRLCQEVTEYHGNSTGIGFQTLLAQNRAWVITRAFYRIFRLPSAFEHIELSTWSRGNNGLIAYRDYRVCANDGEQLMVGTSAWPMIDMTTRRVLRLNEVIEGYENHDECATEFQTLGKLRPLDINNTEPVLTRKVSYTMLDHTKHVNNSEYIKLIFDDLEVNGFNSDKPFDIDVFYQHETKLDDTLSAYRQHPDATSYLYQIINSAGISVIAHITVR